MYTLAGVLLKHTWYGLDSGRIHRGSRRLPVEDDLPKDEVITVVCVELLFKPFSVEVN